jgi:hypothetical protein
VAAGRARAAVPEEIIPAGPQELYTDFTRAATFKPALPLPRWP